MTPKSTSRDVVRQDTLEYIKFGTTIKQNPSATAVSSDTTVNMSLIKNSFRPPMSAPPQVETGMLPESSPTPF